MPKDTALTKLQILDLHLLAGFFTAARKGQIWRFVESEDVRAFIRDAERGRFGTRVPDGSPGSKFPGTGVQNPLDVLDGLFRGPAFGLGRIDHGGRSDPAAAPEGVEILPDGTRQTIHTNPDNGDRVTVRTETNGVIRVWVAHSDGSADGFVLRPDGAGGTVHVDQTPGHSSDFGAGYGDNSVEVDIYAGANSREVVTITTHTRNGARESQTRSVWHRDQSPGEDGRDANSARNPLDGLDVVGPQSLWQMTNALRNPGRDAGKLDPNSGKAGLKLTDEQQKQLGLTAPALKTLDPNSGIDPLTRLNLDPGQLHTRTEKDDRVDPNTGRKPVPGGGKG
jgi:hypothetical protein